VNGDMTLQAALGTILMRCKDDANWQGRKMYDLIIFKLHIKTWIRIYSLDLVISMLRNIASIAQNTASTPKWNTVAQVVPVPCIDCAIHFALAL
jgi:hypothetical protein